MITRYEISAALARLGICAGDWVFFHTSLRSFGAPIDDGADGLIDAVISAVSPGGTVAVPTNSPSGAGIYDPRTSPIEGDLGVTPQVFMTRAAAVRSCHPTHSAAAIGPDARVWMSDHERCRATSAGSPLDKLRRHPCGKVALFGVGLTRLTLIHLGENLARAPYVGPPWSDDDPKSVPVRTWNGAIVNVDLAESPGCSEYFDVAESRFREAGLIQETRIGDCRVMVLPARGVIDEVIRIIDSDPLFLLNRPEHCDWCRRANARVGRVLG